MERQYATPVMKTSCYWSPDGKAEQRKRTGSLDCISSHQVYDKGNTAVEEVSIAYAGPTIYASGENELGGPASHHL